MDREGAETYLRLLAETKLRDPVTLRLAPPWAGGFPGGGTFWTLPVVAQALTAVDALDADTAEAVLADFGLAVTARRLHLEQAPGPGWLAGGITGPAVRAVARRLRDKPAAMGASGASPPTPAAGPGYRPPPERFVPLGLTIPIEYGAISGGLYLMSYAHTEAGAWFTVAWRPYGPDGLSPPASALGTVTDDRGGRYQVDFTGTSSGPEWTAVLGLRPDPPGDLRWLAICPPARSAVRVWIEAAGPEGTAADISQAELDPGEHLLTMIAERLLFEARLHAHDFRPELAGVTPGPLSIMAAGLGEVVAALHATEVLAPASPWPGRLATLCANLRISEPELTAPPAHDLPEPWLSLLARYHRRKPAVAPHRDGAAALAGALPELDGIRLALLGLHNAEATTFLHVLASGLVWEGRPGPFGIDMDFPLSLWIRDSGGRWHLGRPDGRHRAGRQDILRLRLTPPLTHGTPWIEVLAGGQSAEVRATLPLRWRHPS